MIFGILALIFAFFSFMIMIFLTVSIIALFICKAFPLKLMAKQKGMKNSFLAWIPFANFYLLFNFAEVTIVPVFIFIGLLIFLPNLKIIFMMLLVYMLFAMAKFLIRCDVSKELVIAGVVLALVFPFLLISCFVIAYNKLKTINGNIYNDYDNFKY